MTEEYANRAEDRPPDLWETTKVYLRMFTAFIASVIVVLGLYFTIVAFHTVHDLIVTPNTFMEQVNGWTSIGKSTPVDTPNPNVPVPGNAAPLPVSDNSGEDGETIRPTTPAKKEITQTVSAKRPVRVQAASKTWLDLVDDTLAMLREGGLSKPLILTFITVLLVILIWIPLSLIKLGMSNLIALMESKKEPVKERSQTEYL
jgi:hypothetical protein